MPHRSNDRPGSGPYLNGPYLNGQFLVAMPQLQGKPFARAVIYLCVHNAEGAMGLIVNQPHGQMTCSELFTQLGIEAIGTGADPQDLDQRILNGGPVDSRRGFVLHSTDHLEDGSMIVDDDTAVTSTVDILAAIAAGEGPRRYVMALGYSGWGPGQLESELQANAWLCVPADDGILFDADLDTKWHRAIAKLGIDISMLSGQAGHA